MGGLLCSGGGVGGLWSATCHFTSPEGDMRCKWAITSTTPHRKSTWAPTYGHHLSGKPPAPTPLRYLPTVTHWGLEITCLYLCHHFHIICL